MISLMKISISDRKLIALIGGGFIALLLLNISINIRGLRTKEGMQNAQIARELARGNGISTKTFSPFALSLQKGKQALSLPFKETILPPLYPMVLSPVLKITGADSFNKYEMDEQGMIYFPDRIITAFNSLIFGATLFLTFLICKKLFNKRVAFLTVSGTLLFPFFWEFTQTALPQTFLTFLLSLGILLYIKALEAFPEEETATMADQKTALIYLAISTLSICLMVLAHWICFWIFLSFLLISKFHFRKSSISLMQLGMLFILSLPFILRNIEVTGSIMGGGFTLFSGISNQEVFLRGETDSSQSIYHKLTYLRLTFKSFQESISGIFTNLGGFSVVAMIILAIFYPFQKKITRQILFLVLLLFLFASIGQAFWNNGATDDSALNFGNLQILFLPILMGYSFACCQIFWKENHGNVKFFYFLYRYENIKTNFLSLCFIAISFVFLFSDLGSLLQAKFLFKGIPVWPPYYPASLAYNLKKELKPKDVVASDQPWAIGWYADRYSMWIPQTVEDFSTSEDTLSKINLSIEGIHVSPSSEKYIGKGGEEFSLLFLDKFYFFGTKGGTFIFKNANSKTVEVLWDYIDIKLLNGFSSVYYSKK